MNEANNNLNRIEHQLRHAHLAEPSAQLQARTIKSMCEVWQRTPAEIPWQIPVRRLAACIAAALLIVSLATLYGDHVSGPGPHRRPPFVCLKTVDLDTLAEVPLDSQNMVYARNLGPVFLQWESVDAASTALFEHTEQLRQALREAEQGELQNEQTPVRRGSHLLPDRQNHWS